MNLEWYDWVGLLGSLLVVGSYFLLQSGRLSGTICWVELNTHGRRPDRIAAAFPEPGARP